MRKVALLGILVLTGILGIGAVAIADDGGGNGPNGARMNGYQEVSSVSTTGFGSFHIKFNRDMTAEYVLSYQDVETPVTQAHIHFAQRSVNGPIEVWLCDGDPLGGPQPPAGTEVPVCPPTSGTVRGTIVPAEILGDPPPPADRGIEQGNWEEFVAAVKVGHTYANVHSTRFPTGEIRGQINNQDQREYIGPPPFARERGND